MNLIYENNKNILNENYAYDDWGERNTSFTKLDIVIGPDGTVYNTRLVVAYVNDACSILNKLTRGAIAGFLDSLPIIYTFQVDTMATDSANIFINPGFVMKLVSMCGNSPIGVAFVILHEVYHNVFKHAAREQADPVRFSDHDKANAAQDYEINWIIEHTFPDMRDERSARAKGDTIYDKNGDVKQIFGGITERCNGLINPEYKDDIWEDIYDKLGNVPKPNKKQKDPPTVIPMSDDMKEGYADGWEDAIRDLRAKGLVESVKVNPEFYVASAKLLCENLIPGKSKDYNAGYGLGYNAAIQVIMGLLGGGSCGGNNSSNAKLEPVGKDLTPITPKFPVDSNSSDSNGEQDPNTPVDMKNGKSSGSSKGQNQQNNQGSQSGSQSNQQSGSQGNQGGQGQQSSGNSGSSSTSQNGQGQGDNSGEFGNGGSSDNMNPEDSSIDGSSSSAGSSTGNDTPDVYKNGISKRAGSSDDYDAATGKGTYDDITSDQGSDELMSPEEAIQTLKDLANSGQKVKVGTADGGYNGDGDMSTSSHTLNDGSGDTIANIAGVNRTEKLDNPFKDPNKLKDLAGKLDEISSINGGSKGRPGQGITGILGKIEEMLKPKIDWKEVLKDYISGYFSKLQDIGYSKKGLSRDAYYHISDYEGETANRFMLFVDTSGSMFCNPDDLKQCLAEINHICLEVGAHEIELVQFCDGIYQTTVYSSEDLPEKIDFQNVRSGGTTYREIFKYLEDSIDDGKEFNVAVIMTDSDCYYSEVMRMDPEDLGYENKVIWMIIDDRAHQEIPYWTEAEQVIYLDEKDFKKGMAFTLQESKEIKDNSKMLDNNINNEQDTIVLAESAPKRRCINNKLYEAFSDDIFGSYDDPSFADSVDNATVDDNIETLLNNINVGHRVNSCDLDLSTYDDQIRQWLMHFTNVKKVMSYENLYNEDFKTFAERNRIYQNDYPIAIINKDYSIDVYGNLVISTDLPEFIYFNAIKSCTIKIGYNNTYSVDGSFTATLGKYTKLPEGFPEEVDGNYKLIRLNNLSALENTPYTIGGSFIIQMCRNLKDTTNCIKTLYGKVLSDNGIDDDMIMNTSIYAKAKKQSTKSIDSIVNERIAEGRIFNSKISLNEAFKSNILRELFSKPENKKVLNAVKRINIFWSEIPDDIVLPCYGTDNRGNNVQRSLELRRVVNKQYRDYGITIWCDKDKNIKIIGTGNNRDTYTDDKGHEVHWRGNSWLYIDPETKDLLNKRITLVLDALSGSYTSEDSIKECKRLGIKYDKKDVVMRIRQGRIRNINDEMMFTHLYLIPEFCEIAYVIKGTNDIKDTTLNDPALYKNFSYASQVERRRSLQQARLESIKGMYMSAKNANENSPMYRRYFRHILTDDIVRNLFNERLDFTTAINTISEMIKSAKTTAEIIRRKIGDLYDNNALDPLEIDALQDCLRYTGYRTFISAAIRNSAILKKIKDESAAQDYSPYRNDAYHANKYMEDLNILFADPTRVLNTNNGKYNSYKDSYDINFVKTYIKAAEKLATILAAISSFENGNKNMLDELIERESTNIN